MTLQELAQQIRSRLARFHRAAPRRLAPGMIAVGMIAATTVMPRIAAAAHVSGVFVSYEGQQPLASRDLHFENCVTRDSFLAPTHSDGSFAQGLPPGCYNLRSERGAIVRRGIIVDETDLALGPVGDLAPLAPARLFDLEDLFPTLLTSPAPSTAYIFTRDTTVVPSSAPIVPAPSSESEWLRLHKEAEAARPGAPAPVAPEFNEPMDFGGSQPSRTKGPIPPANP